MRICVRQFLSGFALAAFLLSALMAPAQAAMLSTAELARQDLRQVQIDQVQTYLARDEVSAQLQQWGVAPEQAAERVAQLTDEELRELAQNLENAPAGGDGLALVGLIFVILLVLELLGVTNVFSQM